MPELAVVVVTRDSEQRNILQLLVEGTRVARPVQSLGSFPLSSTDPAVRRIHDQNPDVVLLDIPSTDTASALRAREFLERPVTTTTLLEAFVRLTTAQRSVLRENVHGKVFAIVNAKGGCGATTIAVNLALALQSAHGQAALVDLAPLGHAALHL